MKFRFIGNPRKRFEGPESIVLAGVTFPKGELVEVPESLAVKLATNDHFEKAKVGRPKKDEE